VKEVARVPVSRKKDRQWLKKLNKYFLKYQRKITFSAFFMPGTGDKPTDWKRMIGKIFLNALPTNSILLNSIS
jgi:hypothetical protein